MKAFVKKSGSLFMSIVLIVTALSGTAVSAMDFTTVGITDGAVALDGTNDGSVTVSFISNIAQTIFGVQGKWDTTEQEGEGYLSLTEISSVVMTFGGMNNADVPTGEVVWQDPFFSAVASPNANDSLFSAKYSVAADTPAGKYTVRFVTEVMVGGDYTPDTTMQTFTATITVTRPEEVCTHEAKT